MKRFFPASKLTIQILAVVSFFFCATTSCTDVDNTLGNDLIPNDQHMDMDFVTYTGDFMDSYMIKHDSLVTSMISTGLVGSVQDDIFGRTGAEFACQYITYALYDTEDIGYAKADSLVLSLYFDVPEGDTTQTQKINVYLLNEKLKMDSTYYASDNLDAQVDFSSLVTSFEYTGYKSRIRTILSSDVAQRLMERMIDTTGGIYDDSDAWYDVFPGFYFKADDSSPKNASILTVSLDSTTFILYGNNFTDAAMTTPQDTFYLMMTFWIKSGSTPNTSAFVFKHDYSGTPIDPSTFNDPDNPQETTYTLGMDGPLARFEFRDEFIADLKSKIVSPYRTMVINKAYLEIYSEEQGTTRLNNAMQRLGLYTDFYNSYEPIPDYDYTYENNGYSIAYGGYLNRTHNNYGIDITAFVQQLVTKDEPAKDMMGGPSYMEILNPTGAILNTSTAPDNPNPMTLKVTYTLIK